MSAVDTVRGPDHIAMRVTLLFPLASGALLRCFLPSSLLRRSWGGLGGESRVQAAPRPFGSLTVFSRSPPGPHPPPHPPSLVLPSLVAPSSLLGWAWGRKQSPGSTAPL